MNNLVDDKNEFRKFLFDGQLIAMIFFRYPLFSFNYIGLENDIEPARTE